MHVDGLLPQSGIRHRLMRPSASVIGELVNEVLYRKFCRLLLYVLVFVLRNDDYYGFLVDLIEWLYRLSYVNPQMPEYLVNLYCPFCHENASKCQINASITAIRKTPCIFFFSLRMLATECFLKRGVNIFKSVAQGDLPDEPVSHCHLCVVCCSNLFGGVIVFGGHGLFPSRIFGSRE